MLYEYSADQIEKVEMIVYRVFSMAGKLEIIVACCSFLILECLLFIEKILKDFGSNEVGMGAKKR
jgi:hypothetical protein